MLWPWLFVLDLLGLLAWLIPLALVSLPFWYRYVPNTFDNGTSAHGIALGYFPDGPHGATHYGWFIDNTQSALGAAAIGLGLLLLVGNYAVVGAARVHVRAVARWLAAPVALTAARPPATSGADGGAGGGGPTPAAASAPARAGGSGSVSPDLNCDPTLRRCAAGPASRLAALVAAAFDAALDVLAQLLALLGVVEAVLEVFPVRQLDHAIHRGTIAPTGAGARSRAGCRTRLAGCR